MSGVRSMSAAVRGRDREGTPPAGRDDKHGRLRGQRESRLSMQLLGRNDAGVGQVTVEELDQPGMVVVTGELDGLVVLGLVDNPEIARPALRGLFEERL